MARDDQTKSGTVPANGIVELVFTPFSRQDWDIMSVSCDGSVIGATAVGGSAVGSLYRDSQFISFFIANKDTVEGVTIPLGNGRKFKCRWQGATPGATVSATIWYDDGTG